MAAPGLEEGVAALTQRQEPLLVRTRPRSSQHPHSPSHETIFCLGWRALAGFDSSAGLGAGTLPHRRPPAALRGLQAPCSGRVCLGSEGASSVGAAFSLPFSASPSLAGRDPGPQRCESALTQVLLDRHVCPGRVLASPSASPVSPWEPGWGAGWPPFRRTWGGSEGKGQPQAGPRLKLEGPSREMGISLAKAGPGTGPKPRCLGAPGIDLTRVSQRWAHRWDGSLFLEARGPELTTDCG